MCLYAFLSACLSFKTSFKKYLPFFFILMFSLCFLSLTEFFSMESVGDIFSDTFKIALYAKEVGRYLCFRRGKLVGMVRIYFKTIITKLEIN